MDIMKYIAEQALILIPVLYVVGRFLKTSNLNDKYIPWVLLVLGVIGSIGLTGVSINSIIQGVLVTGATVYTNQLIKQTIDK